MTLLRGQLDVAPIVGVVLVLTALVRFFPLYSLLGADTCRS